MINLSDYKYPASEIQKMFWFSHQINPENPAYNIPSVFRIKGKPDISALHKGLNSIINRHNSLRAEFRFENNDLMQIIKPAIDLKLHHADLSLNSVEESEKEISRIIDEQVNGQFNMEEAPLLRTLLIKLSGDEYILSIVMHHIIFDMESKNIFSRELSEIYSSLTLNSPALPSEAGEQYTDFALQQKEIISGNGYAGMIQFWEKSLSGQSGYLNLPHDFQRPPAVSGRGEQYRFEFSYSSINNLREFSRRESVNLFTTMLSLYYILLHRLSLQKDLIVGVPLTNRRSEENKNIIGCFVNIMPLPVTITGNESFSDIIRQVRGVMLGAHRNQEVPYSFIVREISPQRDPGYNPFFQAGFTFEQPMNLELPGLEISNIIPSRHGSQLDIFLTMWESGNIVKGYLEYNSDLFLNESAERIIGSFQKLAETAIMNPDENISALPMLSSEEECRIFEKWNDTDRSYDLSIPLHRLFEIQSELSPGREAVVFRNHTLTYRGLNERANRLARHLINKGAAQDRIVGVYMERSIEMVISLYAILKSGAAYLPLSPDLPGMRLKFMTEDADPVIILTQRHLEKNLPDCRSQILSIDADLTGIKETDSSNPDTVITSENLAYCIYTSGSTGKSKGVLIPHKGICNRLYWMQEFFQLNEHDRILQKTPFDFDVSVWEFFWPLICGAAIVVADPGGHRDSAYLADIIIKERITVIHFVPTMLDIFLREPRIADGLPLRYVICSGEALPYPLQERFFSLINCGLYNLYGPTEASVDVTYWKCSMDYGRKVVPIGFPVANTRMYILNEALQPVPSGVPGDLYIGGIQLARGYLKRDDLTKKRFIPDPFSITRDERLYHTGDRARWLPEGAIEYLGRSDFQIKFHGLRIEPGEIEFAIEQHPAISQAVASSFGSGDTMILVAYYTLKSGASCGINDLRNFLKDNLPQSIIPSMFIELKSFPTTSSGKIDRKAIPEPLLEESAAETIPLNLNSIEKQILSIWRENLKIENIGLHDNFFDIGGHSLLLTLINHKMRNIFGIDITMVEMFRHPTIASMAEYLKNNKQTDKAIDDIVDRRKNRLEAIQRMKKIK